MEAWFTLCWTNVYAYVPSLWSLKALGGWLGRQPSSPLLSSPSPMAVQRGWTRTWRQLCAAWHPLTQALGATTSCGLNMLKTFYATLLMGCPCLIASSCTSPCCFPNRSPRSGSFQDRGSSVTVGTWKIYFYIPVKSVSRSIGVPSSFSTSTDELSYF